MNIACPVRISGVSAKNTPFAEETILTTVSKFGAKVKTKVPLKPGMQVKLEPIYGTTSGLFKVVWVGREGTPQAGEVGLEYSTEITAILGINFPDQNLPSKPTP